MTVDDLYNRLSTIKPGVVLCTYTREKCEQMLPLINEINQLKKERDAVIKSCWGLPTSAATVSS